MRLKAAALLCVMLCLPAGAKDDLEKESPPKPFLPSVPAAFPNNPLTINTPAISRQAQESIARYTSQYQQQIDQNTRFAQNKIETVERNTKEIIDGIPRTLYVGRRSLPNPDYARDVAAARADADLIINPIREFLARDNATAKAELDRHTLDVTRMTTNFLSEVKSPRGPIHIVPGVSGMNVKNYVNFGEDSTPVPPIVVPIKAKQEKYKTK